MKGNKQEMCLHKQVRQGQPGLMRTSQYGNQIDGTTLPLKKLNPELWRSVPTDDLDPQDEFLMAHLVGILMDIHKIPRLVSCLKSAQVRLKIQSCKFKLA